MRFSPYVALVTRSTAAVALPAVTAVSGRAVVLHVGYCGSDAHGTLVHGNWPPLIPVPAVHVTEVAARRWRRLGPADWLKALWVTFEGRIVPVRSRPSLLRLRLTIEAVASAREGVKLSNWTKVLNTADVRAHRGVPLRGVPVIRVGLSGVKAGKTVGVPVVVGPLVHADVAIRLDLFVAIPIGVISSAGT